MLKRRQSSKWAILGYVALLLAFWIVGQHFGIAARFNRDLPWLFASFAILLAPYWAFGFGFDEWLRARVTGIPPALLLVTPYLIYAIPTGCFRWTLLAAFIAIILAVTLLLAYTNLDWLILIVLALAVELHYFDQAWPLPFAKLLFVDLALYGYLVIRPIGRIGFDFRPHWVDLRVGVREFVYFTPVALLFGFATQFLHLHRTLSDPVAVGAAWLFTLFFVAVPEELFFRGIMLNLLERRLGTRAALAITAVAFGLAHFNKRTAFFNGRYVILAAIAGVFYGRAWLSRRRVLTSSVTHATVDTVWSIWLR